MKNYKYLVPIALAALLLLGIYTTINTRTSDRDAYQAYITKAREFREQGVIVDAQSNYFLAYELNPSIDLAVEIGQMYNKAGLERKARDWGLQMIDDYPKEAAAYEFMVKHYYELGNFEGCYEIADKYHGRKLTSQTIDDIMEELKYAYHILEGYEGAGVFSGGYCAVELDGKWGYIDKNGRKTTDMAFAKAGAFSVGGLAPVIDLNGESYFIDTEGNKKHVVLDVENVKEVGYISDNKFPLYDGNTWAFYSYDNEKCSKDYQAVSALANGLAAVEIDSQWMIIDSTWEPVIDKKFASVVIDEKTIAYRNGRLFVEDSHGFHMIDASGKEYGTPYDEAMLFLDNTYAAVRQGDQWGFVDAEGTMIITPQYQAARSFSNGLAAVEIDNAWGYIDLNNQIVIEPQYDDAKDFTSDGETVVRWRNKWQLIRFYKNEY